MFKKIILILTKKERKKLVVISTLSLLMAVLDMAGIYTILPFMSVIANPRIIETNTLLQFVYTSLRFSSLESFIFFLGLLVFLSIVISVGYKLFVMRMQLNFILEREYSISKRLLESYLLQPYEWFLKKKASELGKNVLSDVNTFVNSALLPFITLITNLLLLFAILALLLYVDFSLTIFSFIFFGVFYSIIFKYSSRFLMKIGSARDSSNEERFNLVNGIFSSIKEVKLTGFENEFLKRYDKPARAFASNQAMAQVVNLIPRFAIEVFAFGGLVLFILYFINFESLDRLIPILSVFAFAAFRLMPVLQNIFGSLNIIKYSGGIIDLMSKNLTNNLESSLGNSSKFNIRGDLTLKLENIFYSYPDSKTTILNGISLELFPGRTIAIVGMSGSGKTTLVDVLIGLLKPTQGSIHYGDIKLSYDDMALWQNLIGYVPQDIYLMEDLSIASNIAFGIPQNEIDLSLVIAAAELASVHNFISSTEYGYDTILGGSGIRISGGQRQRIGLARAYYKQPKLLVLDEATSALDSLTENTIMETIFEKSNITTVIVTHRLNTIKHCDVIYLIKSGEILQFGSYNEMYSECPEFLELVEKFEN